jgi:hypothetical protein
VNQYKVRHIFVSVVCKTAIVLPNDNSGMLQDKKHQVAVIFIVQSAIKLVVLLTLLSGCTPAFNWRETGFDQAGVTALLPCKPDRGTRAVQLAGQTAQMSMAGCEAGGAMFTVSLLEAPSEAALPAIAQDLKVGSKATHSKVLTHGRYIAQAAIYGQPKEGRDGPGTLSAQAVETFLTNLKMAGAK